MSKEESSGESASQDVSGGDAAKREEEANLYENRGTKKIVRVFTVMAYMISVSFVAVSLSSYYLFIWEPPNPRLLHETRLSAEPQVQYLIAEPSFLPNRSEEGHDEITVVEDRFPNADSPSDSGNTSRFLAHHVADDETIHVSPRFHGERNYSATTRSLLGKILMGEMKNLTALREALRPSSTRREETLETTAHFEGALDAGRDDEKKKDERIDVEEKKPEFFWPRIHLKGATKAREDASDETEGRVEHFSAATTEDIAIAETRKESVPSMLNSTIDFKDKIRINSDNYANAPIQKGDRKDYQELNPANVHFRHEYAQSKLATSVTLTEDPSAKNIRRFVESTTSDNESSVYNHSTTDDAEDNVRDSRYPWSANSWTMNIPGNHSRQSSSSYVRRSNANPSTRDRHSTDKKRTIDSPLEKSNEGFVETSTRDLYLTDKKTTLESPHVRSNADFIETQTDGRHILQSTGSSNKSGSIFESALRRQSHLRSMKRLGDMGTNFKDTRLNQTSTNSSIVHHTERSTEASTDFTTEEKEFLTVSTEPTESEIQRISSTVLSTSTEASNRTDESNLS